MKLGTSHQIKASPCPGCNEVFDGATQVGGDSVPVPGDLCVCMGCGSFNAYAADLTLRSLGLEEIAALPDELRIQLQRMRRIQARIPEGLRRPIAERFKK